MGVDWFEGPFGGTLCSLHNPNSSAFALGITQFGEETWEIRGIEISAVWRQVSPLFSQLSLYTIRGQLWWLGRITGLGILLLLMSILVNSEIASKGTETILFLHCQLLELKQNQACSFPSHCALQLCSIMRTPPKNTHSLPRKRQINDRSTNLKTRVGCVPSSAPLQLSHQVQIHANPRPALKMSNLLFTPDSALSS